MKQFEKVQVQAPKKAVHDLSYERKLTGMMGQLIPVLCEETLPGDQFKLATEMLIRLQPMLAPVMHRINAYIHYFFVPNRIVWNEWEDFITGGQTGELEPNLPKIRGVKADYTGSALYRIGTLADYLGIPVTQFAKGIQTNNVAFSELPFRAYQQIYNDYYRDPIIQPLIEFDKGSLDSDPVDVQTNLICAIRRRAWEKDYFTTALPNPQLGEAVTLPLGTSAPVVLASDAYSHMQHMVKQNAGIPTTTAIQLYDQAADPGTNKVLTETSGFNALWLDPNGSLIADLTEATASTINDLRRAYALQRWLEKNARGGPRYFEQILSHFGVNSPDSRLQRAEYIGGGRVPIRISEVLQTSETTEVGTPQGTMAGHAFAQGFTASGKYFSVEHGYIIGILSVMPRTGYFQGMPKHFLKTNKYDFFWPEFAHIGEQEMSRNELYLVSQEEDTVFGYVPRYQEYRYNFDQINGEMREDYLFWHMAREFTTAPALNSTFIECVPTERIWPGEAGSGFSQMIVQMYHKIIAKRPVPKYGTPI